MIDMRQSWKLDEDGMRLLQLMSNQAAIAIESALMGRRNLRRQRLEAELAAGREIQLGLLPSASPEVQGWEFAAFYQAAGEVGGDFYDFVDLPGEPGRLGMVIADVVGKGVPAALYMALSRTTIRASALAEQRPASVLQRANRLLLQESHSGLFLTALYAVLDTGSGQIRYANAGHNRPLWLRTASGEIGELNARGTALGALEEIKIEECEIDIAPGDLLAFYTDGVTEAMDASGQLFGQDRLREAIGTAPGTRAQQVVTAVVDAVKTHVGKAPQSDDLTLFVVKRSPSGN
jgi:serine phosphatase RsbU (regulator of sigma subunit)